MKRILSLPALLLLFSSCCSAQTPPPIPGWHIPIGIQILAWIGVISILVLIVVLILAFGEPVMDNKKKNHKL